jgi:hypothetical protein
LDVIGDAEKAEETTVDNTGAVVDFDDFLADPDLDFEEERISYSGYGLQGGYRHAVSQTLRVEGGIELGLMHSEYNILIDDLGNEDFVQLGLQDPGFYWGLGARVLGDFTAGRDTQLNWGFGLRYMSHRNEETIADDGTDKTDREIEISELELEGSFGVTVRQTRLFLALAFVDGTAEVTETETTPADDTELFIESDYNSPVRVSIGAEANLDKVSAFGRLYVVGGLGGSAGVIWRF